MHTTTILVSAIALIAGAQAGVLGERNDPHIMDFRLWGSKNCEGLRNNFGIWTITQSDTNKCTSLHENDPHGLPNHGILLGNPERGFGLYLYTDEHCKHGELQAKPKQCNPAKTEWRSFIVKK